MPHVLRQLSVPDEWLKYPNTFYEVTVENYRAIFAASSQAEIGLEIADRGTVKIQVSRKSSMTTMKACCVLSTVGLLLALFTSIYGLVWGLLGFTRT